MTLISEKHFKTTGDLQYFAPRAEKIRFWKKTFWKAALRNACLICCHVNFDK